MELKRKDVFMARVLMPKEILVFRGKESSVEYNEMNVLMFFDTEEESLNAYIERLFDKLKIEFLGKEDDAHLYDGCKIIFSKTSVYEHQYIDCRKMMQCLETLKPLETMGDIVGNKVSLGIDGFDRLRWDVTAKDFEDAKCKTKRLANLFGEYRVIASKENAVYYETPICRINMYYKPNETGLSTMEDRIIDCI